MRSMSKVFQETPFLIAQPIFNQCISWSPIIQCMSNDLLMKKVFCNIFGHHYSVSKKVTQHIKEYKCVHCGKEVTTDVTGNLSALTPELQDINHTLEIIYQKRHGSSQQVA